MFVMDHIPNSINLPSGELFKQDGTFLKNEEVSDLFSHYGIDGSKHMVLSCGSGIMTTVMNACMRSAGMAEGRMYDGSYSEWSVRR